MATARAGPADVSQVSGEKTMRGGELVERIVWGVLFGTVMLASMNARAAGVDMHGGQWRYSVTPHGWLPETNARFRFLDLGDAASSMSDLHGSLGLVNGVAFRG